MLFYDYKLHKGETKVKKTIKMKDLKKIIREAIDQQTNLDAALGRVNTGKLLDAARAPIDDLIDNFEVNSSEVQAQLKDPAFLEELLQTIRRRLEAARDSLGS